MRVLVTGATGVVGVRAIPLLIAAGHEVTAAVRAAGGAPVVEALGAAVRVVDLLDARDVGAAVRGHDAVVNLATHIPPSLLHTLRPGAWRENDRLRRDASRLLAARALDAGVGRFVQESFAPVYPDRGETWIDEATPLAPTRQNRTVLDAERSAAAITAAGGAGVVLRFAAFYGDDHMLDALAGAVRRGWSPLPGREDAFFSSVTWDDAAAAVLAALDAPAGAYNVVDDRPLRRREYVDALAAALGVPPPRFAPVWTARLLGSLGELLSRSQRMSNARLRAATAWRPATPSAAEGWRALVR